VEGVISLIIKATLDVFYQIVGWINDIYQNNVQPSDLLRGLFLLLTPKFDLNYLESIFIKTLRYKVVTI